MPVQNPTFLLQTYIAHLQSPTTTLSTLLQVHAHALRHHLPNPHPLLIKHLLLATFSLSPPPLPYASTLFSLLPLASTKTFVLNTFIRLLAHHAPDPSPSLRLHLLMRSHNIPPDSHTYPFLLKACARLLDLNQGEKIHCLSIRDGHYGSTFVGNALVSLYGACGCFESAHQVFVEIPVRTLVGWNAVINGFCVNGRPNEALTVFREMREVGEWPDGFTVVGVLGACAELGALALGRRVHGFVFKNGLDLNVHVGNALVDLYGKCGGVGEARRVFVELGGRRSVVSWTSLVVGLGLNGCGVEAIEVFERMEEEGFTPSEITFVGVLYACSHCGWVKRGFEYFERMTKVYRLVPKIEHYGCLVDLLGRAGLVEEAYRFVLKMPLEPNAIIWRALLGACAMHKRMAIGTVAWAQLERLDPGHSGDYVLLSNLYASFRQWENVHQIRRRMLSGGVKKTPGISLVELGNRVHEFVMGDRSHPESEEIYKMLEEIALRLRLEGYKAGTRNVLADIEEEEKEDALRYHSERLAIAFALLKSVPGAPIRIVKNLRICEDCHLAIKLISKVYDREIVVRDRSRFHHFKNGCCSCKDYW